MKLTSYICTKYSQWKTFSIQHPCALCLEDCDAPNLLCPDCITDLPLFNYGDGSSCLICAIPLVVSANSPEENTSRLICGQCLKKRPHYMQNMCSFRYEFPIDKWLHKIKIQHQQSLIQPLAKLMLLHPPELLTELSVKHDLALTFVPSPPQQLLKRGFNLAEQLCSILARDLQRPVFSNVLVANRKTAKDLTPQKRLKREDRLKNIRQKFSLNPRIDFAKHTIPKTVILVDDVTTTGATINHCAQLLKQAGAEQVYVWCLARATLD